MSGEAVVFDFTKERGRLRDCAAIPDGGPIDVEEVHGAIMAEVADGTSLCRPCVKNIIDEQLPWIDEGRTTIARVAGNILIAQGCPHILQQV